MSLIEKITAGIRTYFASDIAARQVAQAALTAIQGAGDGVQQCDRDAAASIMGWTEGDQNNIRNARMDNCDEVQAFARHRSTAAAAERARIVAWLRKEADALAVEQADTRQGSPDWLCLREQVEDYQIIADAIERGEV